MKMLHEQNDNDGDVSDDVDDDDDYEDENCQQIDYDDDK